MKDEDINLLSYVKISENRTRILKSMEKEMQFPSIIAKSTKIRINQVSTTLKELKEKHLVECINEKAKVGRFYQLTKKGKEIAKLL